MAAKSFGRLINAIWTEVFGVQTSAGVANAGDIPALSDDGTFDVSLLPTSYKSARIECQFYRNDSANWAFGANSGGTTNGILASELIDHPGCLAFRSSATANSGYRAVTPNSSMSLGGGEVSRFVFYVGSPAYATSTIILGYTSSISNVAGTDECCIAINAGVAVARCSINSASSSSATIATLTADVFYRAKIVIADDGSSATFSIYTDAGVLVGTQTLSSNLPTDGTRRLGHGVIATSSGTTNTQIIAVMNYMSHENAKSLRIF